MEGMQDTPFLTKRLTTLVNTDQFGRHNDGFRDYAWIPLVRLAYSIPARKKTTKRSHPPR